MTLSAQDVQKIKSKLYKFCAYRERSEKEVLDKLNTLQCEEAMHEEFLEDLKQQNFIDEQRFAAAFCRDKFNFNSWGRLKIRANISIHKIDSELIEKALNSIEEDTYLTKIYNLVVQKDKSLNIFDATKKKQKIVNFLTSKGFESQLIWNSLNQYLKNCKTIDSKNKTIHFSDF